MAGNMEDSPIQKKKKELWEALQDQDTDTVKHILCHGVKVNCKLTDNHVTPLHYCAQVGDGKLFKWLLSKGASVKKRDRWMDTVLHYACKYNQMSIVEIIVSVFKKIILCKYLHLQGKKGYTPVKWVVGNRNFDLFKQIVEASDLTNVVVNVQKLRTQVIKDIVLNACEKDQVTFMDLLCGSDKMVLFKEISKRKVKNSEFYNVIQNVVQNFSQADKEKCVEYVTSIGSVSVLKILLNNSIGYSVKCIKSSVSIAFKSVSMQQTMQQKYLLIAKMLLDAGPDVEYEERHFIMCAEKRYSHLLKRMLSVTRTFAFWSEESHQRIMYAAIRKGSKDSVDLIANTLGTDFVKTCSKALNLALIRNSLPLYMYFKDKGLKLSERCEFLLHSGTIKLHPMEVAVITGNIEFVNLLVSENVVPQSREDCVKVIKMAIKEQNENIIVVLLSLMEQGILNIDNSVCVEAVMTTNIRFVKMLTQHGLKFNSESTEDHRSKTPLLAAVKTGVFEMVELCCQANAVMSRHGVEIEEAITNNFMDILKLLLEYGGREVFENIVRDHIYETNPLHVAVINDKKIALEIIFDCDSIKDIISEFLQNDGNFLLQTALENKNKVIMCLLLQNGAAITEPEKLQERYSRYGYITGGVEHLLHIAYKLGDCETVSLLIKHSAKFNLGVLKQFSRLTEIKDIDFWKEIVLSISEDCTESIADVFHDACQTNNIGFVKALLQHQSLVFDDIDVLIDCLCYVISYKNKELMELLLNLQNTDLNRICFVNTKCENFRMNQTDDYGKNIRLIHLAAAQSAELCKILLAHGADPNVKTEKSILPIHIAVMNQQTGVTELLLQNKEAQTSLVLKQRCQGHDSKSSLLHIAMKLGDIETVKLLLNHTGQGLVNATDNVSKTPLFYIANWKSREFDTIEDIIKKFIDAGADINHLDRKGNSILVESFQQGNTSVIRILLKGGLRKSIIQSLNWNLVRKYIKEGSYDIITDLLSHDYNLKSQIMKNNFSIKSLLHDLKYFLPGMGNTQQADVLAMIKCLLENGAKVNHFTSLKECITTNWRELAEVLLYHAISQSSSSQGNLLPKHVNELLGMALKRKQVEIAKLFLEAGATFESSKIVIQIVRTVGHPVNESIVKVVCETFDKVIQKGANVNSVDEKGQTGLILATEANLRWLVKKLIQHNCNLDTTSSIKGRYPHLTAVQIACVLGHTEIAQILIQQGASCGSTSSNMTLLHYIAKKQTCRSKRPQQKKNLSHVVELCGDTEYCEDGFKCFNLQAKLLSDIVEKGVDIDAVSAEGCTALHYAADNDDLELTKMLVTLQCDTNVMTTPTSKSKQDFPHCTAIQIAAKRGFIDIVDYLLKRTCTVQLVDTKGKTLLHDIAAHSNTAKNKFHDIVLSNTTKNKDLLTSSVEKIIRAGIDINAIDHAEKTAMNYAIKKNNELVVKLLLDYQVDLTKEKQSSLLLAAKNHRHKIMKYLIEYGANVNQCDLNNNTPLHHICNEKWYARTGKHFQNYREAIVLLLNTGADINAQNKRNETPVEQAIRHGNLEALELMVQHNKNTKFFPKDGKIYINACKGPKDKEKCAMARVLQMAMTEEFQDSCLNETLTLMMNKESPCSEIVKLLLRMGGNPNIKPRGDNTLLHLACKSRCNLEILQLLLSFKADLNSTNKKLETPLHVACHNDNIEAMQLLLQCGAKSNVQDTNGWTLLHICVHKLNKQGTEVLVNYNANIDVETNTLFEGVREHSTPLMICLETDSHRYDVKDIAQVLIENGANPNVTNRNGNNILLIAVDENYGLSYIESLGQKLPDINHQNNKGWTALHYAVTKRSTDIVQFLLKNDCDVNMQISDVDLEHGGETALHIAFKMCHLDLLESLLKSGANIFLKDGTGKTPVQHCLDTSQTLTVDTIKCIILAIRAGGHIKAINGKKYLHVTKNREQLTDMLIQSGCKFIFNDHGLGRELDEIESIISKQQAPLTLKRLAANVVRTNVRPNPLCSAKHLPLPEIIINFLTFENDSVEVQPRLFSDYDFEDDYYYYYSDSD